MGTGSHGSHGSHVHNSGKNEHKKPACSKTLRLSIMLLMTFAYFLVELIVGEITHSLTLIADSFHMLSDVIALCIGLFSVRISKKQSSNNTFGWVRAEVLGALVNSVFLVSLSLSILIEAFKRFIEKQDIHSVDLLLYVACSGLLINIIGLVIFGHGHSHSVPPEAAKKLEELQFNDDIELGQFINDTNIDSGRNINADDENENFNKKSNKLNHNEKNKTVSIEKNSKNIFQKCCFNFSQSNLNIRAVFLHVLADALGSVVVIISALLNKFSAELGIRKEAIRYIDPCLCVILVGLILTSTIPLFKETALILLQTVPKGIELSKLKEELKNVEGILAIHELHIWKLSGDKIIASAHITCHTFQEYMQIAAQVKEIFHKKGIHSTTIQPEFIDPNSESKNNCLLECIKDCDANKCCDPINQSNGIRIRSQSLTKDENTNDQLNSLK